LGPIPNPQYPIPNTQTPKILLCFGKIEIIKINIFQINKKFKK